MAHPRRGLDLDQITRAALELLDEAGLTALTTRRLAERLSVRSPTLYWHLRDKEALLDLVAEAICADAFTIDDTLPWHDQLAQGLQQFRTMLLAHRDAARLLRTRPPSGAHRLGHIDTTLQILLRAGFGEDDAAAIARLLATHVISSVEYEQERGHLGALVIDADLALQLPALERAAPALQRLTGEGLFELGCQVLIAGLRSRAPGAP